MTTKSLLLLEKYKLFRASNYWLYAAFVTYSSLVLLLIYTVGLRVDKFTDIFHSPNAKYFYNAINEFCFSTAVIAFSYFVAINTTKELSQETLKKNIIDGMSRLDFITSKSLMIVGLSFLFIILEYLRYIIIGSVLSINPINIINQFELRHFLSLLAGFICAGYLGLFAGLLFRNILACIGVLFFLAMIEGIANFLDENKFKIGYSDYTPFATIKNIVNKVELSDYNILAIAIYLVIFILLSKAVISKKQLA